MADRSAQRLLFLVVVASLLTSCASPAYVAQLEDSLATETARAAALDGQLQQTIDLLNATATDLRKYDALYEGRVQHVESLEQQLTFERMQREQFREQYEACVAKYAPKMVPSAAGYTTVPYDDLMRYSDDHVGEEVRYRGEVLQVSERSTGSYVLRVATDDSYDDVLWVEYEGPRVLEEDIVMLYGTFDGLTTYEAVLGNDITVPQITADTITVLQKAGDR